MTTTDAAAARRHPFLVALAVVIGFAGFGLAGCGGSLFEAANNTTQEPAAAPKAAVEPVAKVALNSIVGPPDALGKQLHQEFSSALDKQRVTVSASKDEPLISISAPIFWRRRKRTEPRFPTCWMSAIPAGKRVNRFTGEEMVPGNPSRDPWAAITPPVAQSITAKATGSFVAWLPMPAPPRCLVPATPPAGVGGQKERRLPPRRLRVQLQRRMWQPPRSPAPVEPDDGQHQP